MRWYGRSNDQPRTAGWTEDFPDYEVPKEVLDLVEKGLAKDISSKHEFAPSFGKEVKPGTWIQFWVDHPDKGKRSFEEDDRFLVALEGDEIIHTHDVNEAVRAYLSAIGKEHETDTDPNDRLYDLYGKRGDMTEEERLEYSGLLDNLGEQGYMKSAPRGYMFSRKKNRLVKISEWGHGDTLDGQMMKREYRKIQKDIEALKKKSLGHGPEEVIPRWRGEIRRAVLLLPPIKRIQRMSMSQLVEVRDRINRIHSAMNKYKQNVFTEILGI